MRDLNDLLTTYASTRPAIRLSLRGAGFALVSRPDVGARTWSVFTDDADEDDDRPIGMVVDLGPANASRARARRGLSGHRWRVLPVCGVVQAATCASLRHAVSVVYAHRRPPAAPCAEVLDVSPALRDVWDVLGHSGLKETPCHG